ncbi:MAG: hypothetical protein OEV00_11945, partial [Acidobacteriota bacterium]|nr:hypothetical protein [Acidobacteriota bacterium]
QRAIERAVNRFVGKSSEARDALRTQILEWGGAPGEHNDARFPANDERMAARSLRDPARVARWRWTELRYPERMGKLTALTDEAFRQDLLEAMSRRLAIARAIPAAQQLRQRQTEPGQWETAGKMLRTMQERLRERPLALTSLVRFLRAAGLSDTVVEPRRTER